MSATTVATGTSVSAEARSVTVVATEIMEFGMRITSHYGLHSGALIDKFDSVLTGLRVWLAAKQLAMAILEVFDDSGRLLRKWELPVNYEKSESDGDHYGTRSETLDEFLAQDRLAGAARYRLLVRFRTDEHIPVKGWKKAKASDDSHLERREVSARIVGTEHIQVAAYVYTDPLTKSGEPE